VTEQLRLDDVGALPSVPKQAESNHMDAVLPAAEQPVGAAGNGESGVRDQRDEEDRRRRWSRELGVRETMFGRVCSAIREVWPDAIFKVDKHTDQNYAIVKLNGRTAAYVHGPTSVRIDSPRNLTHNVLIVHPAQVEVAIEFIQEEVAAAWVTRKK